MDLNQHPTGPPRVFQQLGLRRDVPQVSAGASDFNTTLSVSGLKIRRHAR